VINDNYTRTNHVFPILSASDARLPEVDKARFALKTGKKLQILS